MRRRTARAWLAARSKAMSLVVVLTALPARLLAVPGSEVAAQWPVVLNLLAGSLLGAWLGAGWATRLRSDALHRVIAVLLVTIAAVLLAGLALAAVIVGIWIDRGFGALSEQRLATLAATLIIVGIQVFFSSFLLSILDIGPVADAADDEL